MANMYHIDGKIIQMEGDSGLEKFTVGPNKARKPNWTENEVILLLEEYSKRRHYMKPKFGTMVPMSERQKCWSEIADFINASEGMNGCYRSVKEVQKKWENLSNRMRSEFATVKVDPTFRLSDTSVAINNILSGDGTFDSATFTKGYKLFKPEKCDDEEYFKKEKDSYETPEEIPNGTREPGPVLNIPFKANSRFQRSLENCVSIAPHINPIYSSLVDQSSTTSQNTSKRKLSQDHEEMCISGDSHDEEVVFPSGESVFVTSPVSLSSQSNIEKTCKDNSKGPEKDKDMPNPETFSKLKEVMLKRASSVNSSSGLPLKKPKLENAAHVCPIIGDESVNQLYKQVLIMKKKTLKKKLEKLDLEKEKLKVETEKLRLEKETAKICKDKCFAELVILKQKCSALL